MRIQVLIERNEPKQRHWWQRRRPEPILAPTEDEFLQRERAWLSNLTPSPECTFEMIMKQIKEVDEKRREIASNEVAK